MLESAGLGGLAKTLPSAASKELYDRVASYITKVKCGTKVPPLDYWEPYYRDLYQHIKAKGPQAVFLPEVRVDITRKTETTSVATPVDTTKAGPQDILQDMALTFMVVGSARNASDIAVNAMFQGTIGNIVLPRSGGSPFAIVKVGGVVECISFDYGGLGEGRQRRVDGDAKPAPAANQKPKVVLTVKP